MSLGVLGEKREYELLCEHLNQCYGLFEELCIGGTMPVEDFIKKLESAESAVPVHEFYCRMYERGQIPKERTQALIQERRAFLKKRLEEIEGLKVKTEE